MEPVEVKRLPCRLCGKPLQRIGTARKNGRVTHGDWEKRQLHKQCWKKLQPKRAPRKFWRKKR